MNSLRSLGRAIDYEIERQIGGARVGRAHRAGDPSLGRSRRPHALDAHEGGLVRLPLLPRARPRAGRARPTRCARGCAASMPELPAARRARLVERVGDQRVRRARCSSPRPGWPTTPRRRWPRSTAARPRTSPTGAPATCSATSTRPGCRPRCCRSRPTGSPSSSASSPTARSRATRPRTCSPSASREPKRPKQVVAERGLAQVSDEGELGAVVDEVLAANADAVAEYRAGDDKVRKKKRGFLMGEVDEGHQGPGQPPGPQPAPRPEASTPDNRHTPAISLPQ